MAYEILDGLLVICSDGGYGYAIELLVDENDGEFFDDQFQELEVVVCLRGKA